MENFEFYSADKIDNGVSEINLMIDGNEFKTKDESVLVTNNIDQKLDDIRELVKTSIVEKIKMRNKITVKDNFKEESDNLTEEEMSSRGRRTVEESNTPGIHSIKKSETKDFTSRNQESIVSSDGKLINRELLQKKKVTQFRSKKRSNGAKLKVKQPEESKPKYRIKMKGSRKKTTVPRRKGSHQKNDEPKKNEGINMGFANINKDVMELDLDEKQRQGYINGIY